MLLVSCSSVEFSDLPGGTSQVGVIQPQRHIVLFGLEPAEPQRLFEERQGDVERLLPFLDPNVWTGCRSQVRVLSEVADMYPACRSARGPWP